MNSLEYRNFVFPGITFSDIPTLKDRSIEVQAFFSKKNANFISAEQYKHLLSEIDSIENTLSKIFNSQDKVHNFNSIIVESNHINESLFLSDDTIQSILETHRPEKLFSLLRKDDSIRSITDRTKLTLSRFTEDKDWQHKYHEILRTTKKHHYQLRKPECVRIDSRVFREIILEAGNKIKPWGVSHGKETGTIMVFENLHNEIRTPLLLSTAVFLHYLYEVHHFSVFLDIHPEVNTGELVREIIRGKEPLLPFLTDGNAHDETLYWRKAIQHLKTIVPKIDWEALQDSSEKLFLCSQPSSANLIDLLWDANFIYPEKPTIYHLQQEIWLSLEQHLSNMKSDCFEQFIERSLMFDNLTFLEQLLNYEKKCI